MCGVYYPEILSSQKEIAKRFGVSPATVRDWVQAGAPIATLGSAQNKRFIAETMDLLAWLKDFSRKGLI